MVDDVANLNRGSVIGMVDVGIGCSASAGRNGPACADSGGCQGSNQNSDLAKQTGLVLPTGIRLSIGNDVHFYGVDAVINGVSSRRFGHHWGNYGLLFANRATGFGIFAPNLDPGKSAHSNGINSFSRCRRSWSSWDALRAKYRRYLVLVNWSLVNWLFGKPLLCFCDDHVCHEDSFAIPNGATIRHVSSGRIPYRGFRTNALRNGVLRKPNWQRTKRGLPRHRFSCYGSRLSSSKNGSDLVKLRKNNITPFYQRLMELLVERGYFLVRITYESNKTRVITCKGKRECTS